MPLMPAMRPFMSANIATAAPMIAPPIAADPGVNEAQSILISQHLQAFPERAAGN